MNIKGIKLRVGVNQIIFYFFPSISLRITIHVLWHLYVLEIVMTMVVWINKFKIIRDLVWYLNGCGLLMSGKYNKGAYILNDIKQIFGGNIIFISLF